MHPGIQAFCHCFGESNVVTELSRDVREDTFSKETDEFVRCDCRIDWACLLWPQRVTI